MRTYGRVKDKLTGALTWQVVTTDAAGRNDYVWLTTLCQCLLLNLGESPFFSNFGIPAHPSVIQQLFPDFYVTQTQQQFALRFANLIISKVLGTRDPTYNVNVTTHQGVKMAASVPT